MSTETICVDFNARLPDGTVNLQTRGTQASLSEADVHDGDWVWLFDGEVRVRAHLTDSMRGARVVWATLEDV